MAIHYIIKNINFDQKRDSINNLKSRKFPKYFRSKFAFRAGKICSMFDLLNLFNHHPTFSLPLAYSSINTCYPSQDLSNFFTNKFLFLKKKADTYFKKIMNETNIKSSSSSSTSSSSSSKMSKEQAEEKLYADEYEDIIKSNNIFESNLLFVFLNEEIELASILSDIIKKIHKSISCADLKISTIDDFINQKKHLEIEKLVDSELDELEFCYFFLNMNFFFKAFKYLIKLKKL